MGIKMMDVSMADSHKANIVRRGLMLVLSSPSAAGKSSIARRILTEDKQLKMSVSVTTRPPRDNERDGIDYHYIDQSRFDELVTQGALLEYAKVFQNFYGTPAQPVEDMLSTGSDVLFDIDWQGAQQLVARKERDVVRVFVLPPSIPELKQRLAKRASETPEVLKHRMSKAENEMSHWIEYDYVIVNDDLDHSVACLHSIVAAERLKRARQTGLLEFVSKLRLEAQEL